jgi:uncharacterized phage-associated protein
MLGIIQITAVGGAIMRDVLDYAKYFIKNKYDTERNKIDGNMKLQKLLLFTNLIAYAELNRPLFEDNILAFKQGCVIEKVRIRYKNDCAGFIEDSEKFNPEFSQEEYDVLNLCTSIFGKLPARELSELNHTFIFWSKAYNNSLQEMGYKHNKEKAVVSTDDIKREINKIQNMIKSYRDTQKENNVKEIINGIEFIYSPAEIELTDDVIDELFEFSRSADEQTYSVYNDNGNLVIY